MRRRDYAWILLGGATLLLPGAFFWGRLRAMGYAPGAGAELALVCALQIVLPALAILPLADLTRRGGLPAGAALAGGALLAGAIACLFGGVSVDSFVRAWAVAGAAALPVTGAAALAYRLAKEETAGRLTGAVLALFLALGPFWTGRLARELADSAAGGRAERAAVWLSPAMQLSAAFSGVDFSRLPRTYTLWLGPLAPYPSWWAAVAGYAALGALLHGVAFLVAPSESL